MRAVRLALREEHLAALQARRPAGHGRRHATNLGLVGQYAETPQDIGFTMEYSARTAWEAVYRLLGRGPPPPPVFQATADLPTLLAALPKLLST